MNRKGATTTATYLIIGILLVGGWYFLAGPGAAAKTPAEVTSTGCMITPSFNPTGIDAFVPNSNVTPTNYGYIVNGKYVGSTYSPAFKDNVQVLADPTGYLADVQPVSPVQCDKNNVAFTFKNYANATVTIKTDAGTAILTNAAAGGAVNETAMTGSKNWETRLVGVAQKSTGKILWVVEMPTGSSANMSSTGVSATCGGSALAYSTIPNAIGSTNTNSFRVAFEIPAIDNGATVTCNLHAEVIGGKSLAGSVYNSFYTEQKFVDSDGTIKEGVYDGLGNAKYQDKFTYNFALV